MTGPEMLIKSMLPGILKSLGVSVDSQQLQAIVDSIPVLLMKADKALDNLTEKMAHIEEMQRNIMRHMTAGFACVEQRINALEETECLMNSKTN